MSISNFRRKKLLYVFNVFFDVNHSGTIERKDFDLAIERICRMRGWAPGDPKHQETQEILIEVWDGLRARADANRDGQVSHEEWCTMWDEYARNSGPALEWQQRYMNFMFDLEDTSGDGCIDEEEFTSVCSTYGLSAAECSQAFNRFSMNKTVRVDRARFADLWKQYFASEDPNAPGNFIFGKPLMTVDACKAPEVRVMLFMEFIIQPVPVVNEVKVLLGEYDSEHFSGLGILMCNNLSAQWGK